MRGPVGSTFAEPHLCTFSDFCNFQFVELILEIKDVNLCETDVTIRVSIVLLFATLTIRTSMSLISLRKTVTPAALQMALLLIFIFKNCVSF